MGIFQKLFGGSKRAGATGALAAFYEVPQPDPSTPIDQLEVLSVDVETTGLDANQHQLLSIGWVPVTARGVELGAARHVVIRPEGNVSVGQSATIHGLTDDQLASGVPVQDAVAELFQALAGKAMLVHFQEIEQKFLTKVCETHFGAPLEVPIIDTFAIERRHMEKMGTYPRGEDLRLGRVRARYGLPSYRGHHATIDALATAELYLAFLAHRNPAKLKDLQFGSWH